MLLGWWKIKTKPQCAQGSYALWSSFSHLLQQFSFWPGWQMIPKGSHHSNKEKTKCKEVVLTLITLAFSSPQANQAVTSRVCYCVWEGGEEGHSVPFCPQLPDITIADRSPPSPKMLFHAVGWGAWRLYSVPQPPSPSSISRPVLALPHFTVMNNSHKWLFRWPVYQCTRCSPSAEFGK